ELMKMSTHTTALAALIGVAAIAASAASANAAVTWNVAADNGTQTTTVLFPTPQPVITNTGPLYTAGANPVVTAAGAVTFNFPPGLSSAFGSIAGGGVIVQQSTDGHLVLNVHFDVPTSISALINEGGVYSPSGNGNVNVAGGEVVIEA